MLNTMREKSVFGCGKSQAGIQKVGDCQEKRLAGKEKTRVRMKMVVQEGKYVQSMNPLPQLQRIFRRWE